jgi:peptide/nickel transport system permease protein
MGRLSVESTFARNYPVILALIMLYGIMVIISSLLADVVQIILDPRISQAHADEQRTSTGAAAA